MLASVSSKQSKLISDSTVFRSIIAVVVFGTITTISNRTLGAKLGYKHGSMITFLMFFGEYLNYLLLVGPLVASPTRRNNHYRLLQNEAKIQKKQLLGAYIYFCLPGLLGVLVTILQNIAILLLPASVFQMLLSGNIVTGCLVSRIMLGRRITRQQWIGNLLAIVGFIVTALSTATLSGIDVERSAGSIFTGVVLIIMALIVRGILANTEEYLFRRFVMHPCRATAIEGSFGMIWTLCFCLALSFFSCPSANLCKARGYFDDPVSAVSDLFETRERLAVACILTIGAMLDNYALISLVKHATCIYALFSSAMNTLLVWIVAVSLGLEHFTIRAFAMQTIGYALLVAGNYVYHRGDRVDVCVDGLCEDSEV